MINFMFVNFSRYNLFSDMVDILVEALMDNS